MANPQPDEFTRISNELFEAIILAGFKKRQLNIILLVIRLSYGCGRKYAVLRQADFQVIGIDKSDIKKELLLLVECGVLTVNGERVALNKDYDRWRIPRARPAGPERFKQILKRNLAEKRPVQRRPAPEQGPARRRPARARQLASHQPPPPGRTAKHHPARAERSVIHRQLPQIGLVNHQAQKQQLVIHQPFPPARLVKHQHLLQNRLVKHQLFLPAWLVNHQLLRGRLVKHQLPSW